MDGTIYAGLSRVTHYATSAAPTLKCKQANDKFTVSSKNGNGDLKYPIALLTGDEAVYAGAMTGPNYNDGNPNVFLIKGITGTWAETLIWTMTPGFFWQVGSSAGTDVINSTGGVSNTQGKHPLSVKPVISLKEGILIFDGKGTQDDPFIIK